MNASIVAIVTSNSILSLSSWRWFLVHSNTLLSSVKEKEDKMIHVLGSSSTHGVHLLGTSCGFHFPLKYPIQWWILNK